MGPLQSATSNLSDIRKGRPVSEAASLVQNSLAMAPNHEISGCRLHPRTMRNIAPLGWLTSIANNRFKPASSISRNPVPWGSRGML